MLTREQNDLVTRTGPGTPGGEMLRRYWQPVALARELPPGGDPLAVDVLGEELVLFRDDQNRVGLLDRHCCHRGTDLSFGRCENGGLRCLYHGWLYDVNGRCMEQPAEPKGSTLKDKVRQTAYPVIERAGAFFAYMGPGAAPEFPAYDFFTFPDSHVRAGKVFVDCNYLQANEGNYDPAHVGFLHRSFRSTRKSGLAFGDLKTFGDVDLSDSDIDPFETPRIKVDNTDFGLRIFQVRPGGPGKTYLRVTAFGMPNFSVIAGPQGGDGHIGIWHVPIDDHCHWRWGFTLRRDKPIAEAAREAGANAPSLQARDSEHFDDEFHHKRKRANRYLQDRSKMRENYTGMGPQFGVHDAFATESQGSIQNRTKEHLATTDVAILAARRMLLQAVEDVQAGKDPIGVVRDPAKNHFPELMSFDVLVPDTADYADVVHAITAPPRVAAE
jgi:phenylpropionate dioxygenase-like ring-hydroxylating dioxygenase large terminal subunit